MSFNRRNRSGSSPKRARTGLASPACGARCRMAPARPRDRLAATSRASRDRWLPGLPSRTYLRYGSSSRPGDRARATLQIAPATRRPKLIRGWQCDARHTQHPEEIDADQNAGENSQRRQGECSAEAATAVEELAAVVGWGPLARGQVVSKMWEYICSQTDAPWAFFCQTASNRDPGSARKGTPLQHRVGLVPVAHRRGPRVSRSAFRNGRSGARGGYFFLTGSDAVPPLKSSDPLQQRAAAVGAPPGADG
jgi:hypothetical protein